MRGPIWSPLGTLGPEPGKEAARALPPFPTDLAADREGELDTERLFLAWEVARFAWQRDPARFRPCLLLTLAALTLEQEGSTRLPLAPELLTPILASLGAGHDDVIGVLALIGELQVPGGLQDDLFGGLGDYRPLILDGPWLYSQRLLHLEERLSQALAARLAEENADQASPVASPPAVAEALAAVAAHPPLDPTGAPTRLSREQEQAVAAALSGRLAVVTGGPGTGKTSIVVALLRVVARLGSPRLGRVALAAPTGKAAHRLEASVRDALERLSEPAPEDRTLMGSIPTASTLHRLLAYSPEGDRYRRHPGNPLEEELVVVDESSMLDLALADRLLRALPPQGRLVLLGDACQLPSVEAGAVFRDLVAAVTRGAPQRAAWLTRSFRMDAGEPSGRRILALASAILEGEVLVGPELDGSAEGATPTRQERLPLRRRVEELDFAGPELLLATDATQREGFLERWLDERIASLPGWGDLTQRVFSLDDGCFSEDEGTAIDALLAHYDRSRILCAIRGRGDGTGVAAINAWFLGRLLERSGSPARPVPGEPQPGEPVLMTANDYRRGLFNGDQGVVLRVAGAVDGEHRPCAIFRRGGELGAIPLTALTGRLVPAWATTVHKAQGIEVDFGSLILPGRPVRTLTRELVYTALTRARRSVVVVGKPEILQDAMGRRGLRHSGLGKRILRRLERGPAAVQGQAPTRDEGS